MLLNPCDERKQEFVSSLTLHCWCLRTLPQQEEVYWDSVGWGWGCVRTIWWVWRRVVAVTITRPLRLAGQDCAYGCVWPPGCYGGPYFGAILLHILSTLLYLVSFLYVSMWTQVKRYPQTKGKDQKKWAEESFCVAWPRIPQSPVGTLAEADLPLTPPDCHLDSQVPQCPAWETRAEGAPQQAACHSYRLISLDSLHLLSAWLSRHYR